MSPSSRRLALVEDTWFAPFGLHPPDHVQAVHSYMRSRYGVERFETAFEEHDALPIDPVFQPSVGQRLFPLGVAGGATRPSAGYAFHAIQSRCDDIAHDLRAGRLPRPARPGPLMVRMMDKVMLDLLGRQPEQAPRVFAALFQYCEPWALVRFLNDSARLADFVAVAAAIPFVPTVTAVLRLAIRRKEWATPSPLARYRISAAIHVATAGMTAFCALAVLRFRFDFGLQLAVLLAGIVLVRFPHSAFDHLVARPLLLSRLGRFWWLLFLLGYLGLAGVVWLGLMIMPATTLALFLAGSALHFGLGDTEDGLLPGRVPRWLGIVTYGALPILLPIALHPADAAPVLAAMAGFDLPVMLHVLAGAPWLLPAWVLAYGWIILVAWRDGQRVSERLATAAGFALLPPVLAFGMYFSLGHSVRHVLRLGAWPAAEQPNVAARWAATVMVPAGAICAAGFFGLTWLDDAVTTGLLAPAFRIIAALTLPHMIVTSWLKPVSAYSGPPVGKRPLRLRAE